MILVTELVNHWGRHTVLADSLMVVSAQTKSYARHYICFKIIPKRLFSSDSAIIEIVIMQLFNLLIITFASQNGNELLVKNIIYTIRPKSVTWQVIKKQKLLEETKWRMLITTKSWKKEDIISCARLAYLL